MSYGQRLGSASYQQRRTHQPTRQVEAHDQQQHQQQSTPRNEQIQQIRASRRRRSDRKGDPDDDRPLSQPRTSSHDYSAVAINNRSAGLVSRYNPHRQQRQQQQQQQQQDQIRIPSLSSTTVLQSSTPSNVAVDSLLPAAPSARFKNSNNRPLLHSFPHPPTHAPHTAFHQAPQQRQQNLQHTRPPRSLAYRAVSPTEDSSYHQDSSLEHSHLPPDPPTYDFSQRHHQPPSSAEAPVPPTHRPSSYQPPLSSYPQISHQDPTAQAAFDRRTPSSDSTSPQDRARELGYTNSIRTNSTTTPGADNLGEAAVGGGIAGIAYGVANLNERDSGLQALRAIDRGDRRSIPAGRAEHGSRLSREMDRAREDNPYVPEPRGYARRDSGPPAAARGAMRSGQSPAVAGGVGGALATGQADRQYDVQPQHYGYYSEVAHNTGYGSYEAYRGQGQSHDNLARENLTPPHQPENPFGSRASLAPSYPDDAFAGGFTPPRHSYVPPAAAGAGVGAAAGALHPSGAYSDSPYQRRSQFMDDGFEHFNPNDIADDGDDIPPPPPHGRGPAMGASAANRSGPGMNAAPVAGAAAGAGLGAAIGGLASRNASGKYSAVAQTTEFNAADEKNQDLLDRKKRKRWIIIGSIILALVIAGAIVGGVIGGVTSRNKNASTGRVSSADPDSAGLLDSNSASVKALMNNPDLHRVFPGVAYTPLNAQYPACLSNPVSQNNVTKDIAVLSQLTNVIRLYGTDCNQTEMVIEAFKQLNINNMKIWVAVWLDSNTTTNTRGLTEMNSLVQKYGKDNYFKGVILGNEVLFRKDLTTTQLTSIIDDTRRNFTANGVQLPIAVADLGDNWTANLAGQVDTVMSNVHPFFGGVPAAQGAGWAWSFWQTHDVVLTANNRSKENIISEIGWPSGGGNDCGSDTVKCTSSTQGAVAGIDEMNTFMDSFVCQSLKNATNYFWFEAFDEPWKVQFNTPGMEWEDKWGLFDSDRNLKKGVKIPSCPGQSIPAA